MTTAGPKPNHYQQEPTPRSLLPVKRDFERGAWAFRLMTNNSGTLELLLFDGIDLRGTRALPNQRHWFSADGDIPTQEEVEDAIDKLIHEREKFHKWDSARHQRYEASIEALKGYTL